MSNEKTTRTILGRPWYKVAGIILLILIIIGAISEAISPSTDDDATETPTPTATTPGPEATTPAPEPTEWASPLEQIEATSGPANVTVWQDPDNDGGDNGILWIEYDIGDNLTNNMIITGAQRDTWDLLEAVHESGIDYPRVFVRGTFPMQDEYGNVEDSVVVNAGYDRETVDKINFENQSVQAGLWDLMDEGTVHPEFQGD